MSNLMDMEIFVWVVSVGSMLVVGCEMNLFLVVVFKWIWCLEEKFGSWLL